MATVTAVCAATDASKPGGTAGEGLHAAGFGECGVGILYISSHLGPVAAPATCSYLCAHTILHCSAGVALPTSAAPRFAYQMPLLFDSLVYP